MDVVPESMTSAERVRQCVILLRGMTARDPGLHVVEAVREAVKCLDQFTSYAVWNEAMGELDSLSHK